MNIAPAAVAPGAPVDPSHTVFDTYGRDLMSLPGAINAGWVKDEPGVVHINFATDGFRRLADNILRDVVDGVKLVLTTDPSAPAPVPGGDSWADNPTEMARVVAGFSGIVDRTADREHGIYSYTFSTYDAAVATRVKAVVNENFGRWGVHFWTRSLPKPPA